KVLAAEGERAGALTPAERGMIHNVIDFSTVTARDFLTGEAPTTLRANDDLRVADLLAFAQEHKADFVPVLDAEGRAVALVDGFALLLDRDPARTAAAYLRRRPLVVAPGEPALRVLRRLRASRLGAAAVFDGETNFLGVVRAADLVGRLVRQGSSQNQGAQSTRS
ncbi:MAG: CBS domain-containing protein, partial [Rhodospirillales bacterium]|nr:CBS domain-containing protein [Acetobacter sp.]